MKIIIIIFVIQINIDIASISIKLSVCVSGKNDDVHLESYRVSSCLRHSCRFCVDISLERNICIEIKIRTTVSESYRIFLLAKNRVAID